MAKSVSGYQPHADENLVIHMGILGKGYACLKKRHPESEWLVRIDRKHLNRSAADRCLSHKEGLHELKVLDPVITQRMK